MPLPAAIHPASIPKQTNAASRNVWIKLINRATKKNTTWMPGESDVVNGRNLQMPNQEMSGFDMRIRTLMPGESELVCSGISHEELVKIKELCDALAPIEISVEYLCKEDADHLLADKVTKFTAKKFERS